MSLLVGCNNLKLYNFDRGEVLASVGDKTLYTSDIEGMIGTGLPEKDSLAMLGSIVDDWVKREIKIQAAAGSLTEKQEYDIEDMVDRYRDWLLGYMYEEEWIQGRMDTVVTDQQITDYYNENRDEFRLAGPIVKARVARIPAGLRQSKRLEEMFRSTQESDRQDFMNICQKNQYRFDDFSSEWTDFSTVIQIIPFSQSNFDEFLRKRNYYDVEDDQYKYMMAIDAFRPTGDYAPQERERGNIRKIILNKRRQELLGTLEDSLYRAAKEEHKFEIQIQQYEE